MFAARPARSGKVALAVVALLALAVAGLLAYRWMSGPPRLARDDGRATAEAFLERVRTGRADDAWAGTSTEFKSMMGQEEFRRMVKDSAELRAPVEYVGVEETARDGLSLATYRFRPGAGSGEVRVVLAPEGRSWKVERVGVVRP